MLGNGHVRFGGRTRETGLLKRSTASWSDPTTAGRRAGNSLRPGYGDEADAEEAPELVPGGLPCRDGYASMPMCSALTWRSSRSKLLDRNPHCPQL
jgi:hypothetical protein